MNEYLGFYTVVYNYDYMSCILQEIRYKIYIIIFEDIRNLRNALERFNPTDILIGSYVEEKLYKLNKKSYNVPMRNDTLKFEIRNTAYQLDVIVLYAVTDAGFYL
jgi:hypothetical protein